MKRRRGGHREGEGGQEEGEGGVQEWTTYLTKKGKSEERTKETNKGNANVWKSLE